MGNKVTQIVECSDYDVTYGYIIADERFDVQEEILRIKLDPDFIEEYGDEWCIDDVLERFKFSFQWLDFEADCIAAI